MKRRSSKSDPSTQANHEYSDPVQGSTSVDSTITFPKDYKCLVNIRTQLQLARLSDLGSPQVFERTQCLLELTKNVLHLNVQTQAHIVNLLLCRFYAEERNDLKIMIILVLQKVAPLPHINPVLLLGQFISFLSSKSTKVRCQLYKSITCILKSRQVILDSLTRTQLHDLFELVLKELSEAHHRIRSECVTLLSVLPKVFTNFKGPVDNNIKIMSELETQTVISKYVLDADPRVRKNALNALVEMHLCGCVMDQPLYYLAVQSLSDDFEEVRLRALDLVWSLCSLYPNFTMPLANEHVKEKVRLIDDAFSRVCDLVNDVSVVVRTKACVMLASYHDVEPLVLRQTFSKQIMSRLKRRIPRRGAHPDATGGKNASKQEKNTRIQASGDINFNSEEFRVLDSGACGAFIHGLEDEYQEVRNAAIDSICELCMYHVSLVKQAVLCLVDMFNDEIDKIRVNAIQSLRKIGSRTTLEFNSEELEVALGAFEDSDKVAREAAHDLMKVTRLYNAKDLEKLLVALMANVKRYPEDKLSILRCLCEVGKKHDDYIETLVPGLFQLDKRYIAREQPVADFTYTSNVILIINACINNSSILSMLPPYMISHFTYYKRKYADCVPDLQDIFKNTSTSHVDGVHLPPSQLSMSITDSMMVDVEEYISVTMSMLKTLHDQVKRLDFNAALTTLVAAQRNLEYVSTLDSIHAETSYLAILYLKCYKIVIQARKNQSSASYASVAQTAASSLLQYAYKIQYSFLGLPTETLQATMYFRLLANMIWFFGVLKEVPTSTSSPTTIRNMLYAFVCRIDAVQKYFSPGLSYYTAIVDLRSNLLKTSNQPTTVNMSLLHSFITDFLPHDIEFTTAVKRTWSFIISPIANPDKPIKFNSTFPVELKIEAEISHALDTSQIGIEVIQPDHTSVYVWPPSGQFIPTYSNCHKLVTSVYLTLSTWKEPGVLTCRIVRSFDPDIPGLDNYIMKSPTSSSNNLVKGSPKMMPIPTVQHFSTIVISDPLSIYLTPLS
ncbi:armadillo-type protein [Chlamydoabsidia padenii]|nr:armadillo-type protein [Chlamydoabsidia padenii]